MVLAYVSVAVYRLKAHALRPYRNVGFGGFVGVVRLVSLQLILHCLQGLLSAFCLSQSRYYSYVLVHGRQEHRLKHHILVVQLRDVGLACTQVNLGVVEVFLLLQQFCDVLYCALHRFLRAAHPAFQVVGDIVQILHLSFYCRCLYHVRRSGVYVERRVGVEPYAVGCSGMAYERSLLVGCLQRNALCLAHYLRPSADHVLQSIHSWVNGNAPDARRPLRYASSCR